MLKKLVHILKINPFRSFEKRAIANNTWGFSLLEVLLSVSFMTLISFLGVKIQNMGDNYVKEFDEVADVEALVSQMKYLFSNKAQCEQILGGQPIGAPITQLVRKGTNPSGDEVTQTLVQSNTNLKGHIALMISSINIEQLTPDQVRLNINFDRQVNNRLKSFRRSILINAQVNAGAIESCFGNTYDIIDQAKAQLCSSSGGRYDATTGQCFHRNFALTGCGAGEYVAGFNLVGDTYQPQCATIPGFATNCGGETFPRAYNPSTGFQCDTIKLNEVSDDVNQGLVKCKNYENLGITTGSNIGYTCTL